MSILDCVSFNILPLALKACSTTTVETGAAKICLAVSVKVGKVLACRRHQSSAENSLPALVSPNSKIVIK